MSFIAENPLLAPEIDTSPTPPIDGTRGLFPKEDGWYDIDDKGSCRKIVTDEDVATVDNMVGENVEGETFVISTESETETISEEIIAEKGAEIFNNYDGGSYEGELTEDDEEYPLDCALLGNPYESNIATGLYSSAFGGETQARGEFALSAGLKTKSVGRASAAFGYDNITNSRYSFATGKSNVTTGNTSLVFGLENEAGGEGSLAGGTKSKASGSYSVAIGKECEAKGTGSVSLGVGAIADNPSGAFAIGNGAAATGTYAFGVGFNTVASGRSAVAIGEKSIASGRSALAVGNGVTASGEGAAAFGGVANDASTYTTASGKNSLAFGSGAEAQGKDSLAFGYKGTKSVGEASFAMAGGVASGARSVAIGESVATGEDHAMSLACGLSVKTTAKHQLVTGRYNKLGDGTLLHIVGNGADGSHRSNAYTLDENGNGWYAGTVTAKNLEIDGLSNFNDSITVNGATWFNGHVQINDDLEVRDNGIFGGTIETDAIILRSSTEGSFKKFKLTVDDSGAITVAEV